jgi:hypothetical protein
VVVVTDSAVKKDPALVQKYMCAKIQATLLFIGLQGR